jgi:murein DD-endopeptidase MepM/ murein hydrolase activator NlpD
MSKKKAPITLVLLRDSDHPARHLRLRPWAIRLGLGSLALLILLSLGLGTMAILRGSEALQLRELDQENTVLREDIQFLRNRLGQLEEHLRSVEEFQSWTRNLANLDPMDEAALTAGVGGPAGRELMGETAGIDIHLDRLLGRARVLRQSAEEVFGSLRESRDNLARIPSIWPILGGRTSSGFGRRPDPFTGRTAFHRGMDLSARRGTPVMATANARVKKVKRSSSGYGNQLTLDHGDGLETFYAHCDRITVSEGQKVVRGDVVATVGSTGHSTAPHLHYEVRRDGRYVNPREYILPRDFVVD